MIDVNIESSFDFLPGESFDFFLGVVSFDFDFEFDIFLALTRFFLSVGVAFISSRVLCNIYNSLSLDLELFDFAISLDCAYMDLTWLWFSPRSFWLKVSSASWSINIESSNGLP